MRKKFERTRTLATAIAGAVLAMSFSVAPASAAPVVDGDQSGSITIHKFEKPPRPPINGGGNNFGAGDALAMATPDTSGLTPLGGIEFTIQQVNTIDLSTNAGWDAAHNLSSVFAPSDPVPLPVPATPWVQGRLRPPLLTAPQRSPTSPWVCTWSPRPTTPPV